MFKRRFTALVALFVSLGCSSSQGDLLVDVVTDFRSGNDFVAVRVSGDGFSPVVAPGLGDFLAGVRVARIEALKKGAYTVLVELVDANEVSIASRRVVVRVDGSVAITVVLSRRCEGVMCPGASDLEATECLGGQCVRPDCTPENPAACPPAECQSSALCPPPAVECARAECIAGVCLHVLDDGLCAAGATCTSEGCVAPDADAGLPDAGEAVDSGPPDAGADAQLDAGWSCTTGDTTEPCTEPGCCRICPGDCNLECEAVPCLLFCEDHTSACNIMCPQCSVGEGRGGTGPHHYAECFVDGDCESGETDIRPM